MSKFLQKIIHLFLWRLTELFPSRTRDVYREGMPYLRRFYLTPRRVDRFGNETESYKGFGVYLHYFYRGDEDEQLHNHPWGRAVSFILCGGYLEQRRTILNTVVQKLVKPFTFNVIRANDFHRIDKRPDAEHVWTLFITGKRTQDWGFWDFRTDSYTPHAQFVKPEEQGYNNEISTAAIANEG